MSTTMSKFPTRLLSLLMLLLAFGLAAGCSRPAPRLDGEALRVTPWRREVVDAVAAIPVQSEGRIKPLSVLAAFALYDLHGRRDLKYSVPGPDGVQQKVTLDPTEWLLDVWCYPSQADRYPLFRVEHTGVLDALGFANDGQRQDFDYLSFAQAFDAAERLEELAREYAKLEQGSRSTVQEHLLGLYSDVKKFMRLRRQTQAFEWQLPIEEPKLRELFGADRIDFGAVAAHAEGFRGLLGEQDPQMTSAPRGLLEAAEFTGRLITNDEGGAGLIAPPADRDGKFRDVWLTLGGGLQEVLRGQDGQSTVRDALVSLQQAVSAEDHGGKEAALMAFRDATIASAVQHPSFDRGKVDLETGYYAAAWHYQSIHWFLFAFVLAAVCWLVPRSKLLWGASLGVTVLALGMLSYDVWLRMVITDRPPIKNLYDTFLFIAAVGVLLAVIAEVVLPRRIALAAAPFTGALLVMFARMFEVADGSDTMNPLVAVLDSNFWLATHVTTINIGYAAGLVAALLANVWILMRVLRLAHPSDAAAKSLVRMTYGVTCFGLAFAVVGTILGGVWANDSWGRFWGWDPKENGALMICLAQVSLLHARFSGLVRDFGFVVWSAITGAVVVFSWFHVNLLGIGLHSYGFSSGLRDAVWTSYLVQAGFVVVGTIDVLLRPNPVRRQVGEQAAAAATAS